MVLGWFARYLSICTWRDNFRWSLAVAVGQTGCKIRNERGNNQRENSRSWCGCFQIQIIEDKQRGIIMSHLCMMVNRKGNQPFGGALILRQLAHIQMQRENNASWNWLKHQSNLVWYILDTFSRWQTNPEDLGESSCGIVGQAVSKTGQPIAEEQLVEERRSHSRGERCCEPRSWKVYTWICSRYYFEKYLFQHTDIYTW